MLRRLGFSLSGVGQSAAAALDAKERSALLAELKTARADLFATLDEVDKARMNLRGAKRRRRDITAESKVLAVRSTTQLPRYRVLGRTAVRLTVFMERARCAHRPRPRTPPGCSPR